MDPGRRINSCSQDFKKREARVERVLRDIAPPFEFGIEVREQNRPEDNGDEEGVRCDGGIEEVVEGLKGAREAV